MRPNATTTFPRPKRRGWSSSATTAKVRSAKEFTVTQQTSEPYIEIDGLQSEGLAVGVTRSETPLTLYTNDAWEASTSDDSWCSVVSSDNGSGKKTVQLVCASNSTKRERSAEVTFRSKNTPGVVCSFRVNQSGIFAAPVLTLAKDESGAIRLAWDAVMGAVKYMVVLTDNDGAPIAEIDNGAETACDLSAQEVFAKPGIRRTVQRLDPGLVGRSRSLLEQRGAERQQPLRIGSRHAGRPLHHRP